MLIKISKNYSVSEDGHIINHATGRILHEYVGKDGYVRTQFDGKTKLVHRVVASAFIEKPQGKDFVNHKDGNKNNNSVDNLEWCTRSENMSHAYAMKLKTKMNGTKNGRCKLTTEEATFIKHNYLPRDKEFGAMALAKRFNVSYRTVSAIAKGKIWTSL